MNINGSIKKKISIAHIGLIVLLTGALGISSHLIFKNILLNHQEEKLLHLAADTAHHIKALIQSRSDLLKRITAGNAVTVYAEKFNEQILLQHFKEFADDFPRLAYVNEDGAEEVRIAAGKLSESVRNIRTTQIFRDALKKPNEMVMILSAGPSLPRPPVIEMAFLRKGYFEDRFIGIVKGEFPFSDLSRIATRQRIGISGFYRIIDSNGNPLSDPQNEKLSIKGGRSGLTDPNDPSRLWTTAVARTYINGRNCLAARAPVGLLGLSVIAALPYDEFLSELRPLSQIIILVFSCAALMGLAISFKLADTIAAPILYLKDVALEIGAGHFDVDIKVGTHDETRILATSFEKMAADLKAMTADLKMAQQELGQQNLRLENAVRERTQKIVRFNEKLQAEIAERIRIEEERNELTIHLARVQRMEAIGTLAGGIAHNFNNLLMGIQGNISLMALNKSTDDPDYQRIGKIQAQIENGARLAGQLLGYAREGRYEVRSIDLNRLIRETSSTFSATRKEVIIHKSLADNLYRISADRKQIELCLLNLYLNGAEAMPGGGELYLETCNVSHEDIAQATDMPPGDCVRLTIRDTGRGMSRETIEHIFEPFFTTKGLANSTGLGLASVYGVVKGHRGFIDIDSEEGSGTTFKIYLPATENAEDAGAMPGVTQSAEKTILIVDDEAMVLDVGRQMLEALGYRVLPAAGGPEAIALYEKLHDEIDLIVLDMVMPGMEGKEAYVRFKEINPEARVLLSSGYSIDGKAREIMARGCNGFIQKPFGLESLAQKIRHILS